MSEPKIHEKYGPSSSDIWIPCPFSLTVECPRLPSAASLLGDEAHDYGAEVLENPDNISRMVLDKGLDAGTAFEILSIDVADIDIGKNIGAVLQMDQANEFMGGNFPGWRGKPGDWKHYRRDFLQDSNIPQKQWPSVPEWYRLPGNYGLGIRQLKGYLTEKAQQTALN